MLSKNYDFLNVEKKWQNEWINGKYKEIYKFSENFDKSVYVIDTPPPFTSGKLHMGHVLNFIWIDVIARYKRMQNFNVLCPQGWDTQGLPTELKVEQKLKIKKTEREKFRNACVEWTREFIAKMKSQMTMIGYIPDWSKVYKTMESNYWKAVQKSLIEFYKKGMIYRGKHPVHFCPNCGTAIAKAEIEYTKRKTFLNYIKFYVNEKDTKETNDKENFITIATTRPELIQACVAIAVNPKDERYKNLVNEKIEVPLTDRKVKVIADESVDPNFGSGVVMICTYGDEQDVKWVYRYNLNVIKAIDENGRLTEQCENYKGMKVKEAQEKILKDLKDKNFLIKQEEIEQNVGIHERCKKPVEFIITDQIFIKVVDYKDKILEESKNIKWIPDYMRTRFEDWVKNMDWDWVISRQRVFGTPIPFWVCENCNILIPADENELPIDPTTKEKFCPKCKSKAIPVKDVCDCWVDSSITPLIISKWIEKDNDEKTNEFFKHTYPCSLRPQGHEIIRTWAFYTIFRCLILTEKIPFNEILVNGMIFGPDGRKMSKSLGNVIEPNELVEKYGADAIRQWACTFVPGSDAALLVKDIEYGKRFITKLWNASKFIEINLHDFDITDETINFENLKLIDKWILAKFDEIIEKTKKQLENFNFTVIKDIQSFVWHDVCDNYLEIVKYRLYENINKKEAQETLLYLLKNLLKLLAPFIPHITEEIYQIFNNGSVHSKEFPKILGIDKKYLSVDKVIKVIEKIREFKGINKIKVNEEISKVIIYIPNEERKFVEECINDIKKGGKVKEVEVIDGNFKVECVK